MQKVGLIFFTILCFLNIADAQVAARDLSLLTVQCKAGEGVCYTQEIVRYDFKNGEFSGKETILSMPTEAVRFDIGENVIYQNRYVIGSSGSFFDLQTKALLGDNRGQLVETVGNDLIVEVDQTDMEGFFAFDLETKRYRKLPSPNVFELEGKTFPNKPGKLSPGKKRFAYFKHAGFKAELVILELKDWKGVNPRSVKGTFYASCNMSCSGGIEAPFVWLDDETILTQRSNGEIVTIDLKGRIEPVVKIKVAEDPYSLPFFEKGIDGDISYYLNGDDYSIDVKNKLYTKEKTVLGNDFEALDGDGFWAEYFYKGKSIGRIWSSSPVTSQGYLYIDYAKEGQNLGSVDGFKIWNDIKKDWLTIEVSWGVRPIGWIKL